MSRRKTKANEIRNPEHYFNKYIAMEIRKDREKEEEYYEMFDSLDGLTGATTEIKHDKLMLLAMNVDGSELDNALAESTLFGWIDCIENPTLHKAIRLLPKEDLWFLTMRYKYGLSQTELAQMLNVSQVAICKREGTLKKYFKKFFKKGYRKP